MSQATDEGTGILKGRDCVLKTIDWLNTLSVFFAFTT